MIIWVTGCVAVLGTTVRAEIQVNFADVASKHPAGQTLTRLYADPNAPVPADFKPTGLTRNDYLKLIAGNVDFWKQHQNPDGAIIDPYEKAERQYSTPAFALSAAMLVREAKRDDLLDPSVRAFSFSLTALLNKTTANQHADFYIPMLVHAYRILKTRVPADVSLKWDEQMKAIVPEVVYRDKTAGANWNVVNVSGEALRRKSGLVATTQTAAQQDYLDRSLEKHRERFTALGMFADPNVPLAYDAFPRLWLEDMIADGAYDGPQRNAVEDFLLAGGLSSLLLMSPSGEWPSGGRSAQHQWNEAQNAVIAEINAVKWKQAGRSDLAGAFKRSARMGLKSMFRWQRASGEMHIVKNFADPSTRHGFEGYGFHSQYNLLPMGMLCIAFERADESIDERPMPSEYASYVFDVRDTFTKVVAAAGGYYVLVETNADHHYDGTGLQRIHRRGIELSPMSDSVPARRGEPALTPGVRWKDGNDWISLADFHRLEPPPKTKPGEKPAEPAPQRVVKNADLKIDEVADTVGFTIRYELEGPGARPVIEQYSLGANGVSVTQKLEGEKPSATRFVFPALVNDGARDTQVTLEGSTLRISRLGGSFNCQLVVPPGVALTLHGNRLPTHNGFVQAVTAELPGAGVEATWNATLEPVPLTAQ